MRLSASTAATYAAMLGKLLPRGPIWSAGQAALGALLTAFGAELNAVHARLVDLMEEAFPNTADELLADWLRVWGLPGPCSTMPATDAAKRELLAGKVAAQGGQSRAYFIGVVRAVLGDLTASVTIEERPNGVPFRVSINRVGDRLGGVVGLHVWIVHIPTGTSATKEDAIDCIVQAYKPAHTIVTVQPTVFAYYSSPGGGGNYAEASTSVAALAVFPGAGAPVASIVFWARNMSAGDLRIGDAADNPVCIIYSDAGVTTVDMTSVEANMASAVSASGDMSGASWSQVCAVLNGTTITVYGDGVAGTPVAYPAGTWVACADLLIDMIGDIRNIMVIDRAITADEVAALFAAGETHDVLTETVLSATEVWAGGQSIPVVLHTPAVAGSVANSGDGGACSLVLNGDFTSELD